MKMIVTRVFNTANGTRMVGGPANTDKLERERVLVCLDTNGAVKTYPQGSSFDAIGCLVGDDWANQQGKLLPGPYRVVVSADAAATK